MLENRFIRKLKANERGNPTRHIHKLPALPGHEIVYKPYGDNGEKEGRGYYYVPISPLDIGGLVNVKLGKRTN